MSLSGLGDPKSGSFAQISSAELEAIDQGTDPRTRKIRPDSTPPGLPPRDQRLGETLVGRYRVEKLIGKGGMGRVYLATQFPLNRAVAVKILSPEFQRKDPQFVRRFFLEAATAARLNHPNTITVYDYGETERGELFIAMEYLKGRPLSRVIASEGPFSGDRTMHIAMQVIRALREAHGKGIIHRDLKPGNIMILDEGDDADFAKVLDFGLVKVFNTGKPDENVFAQLPPDAGEGELTRAGMFLGSPKYMSPEQIQGTDLDPRTDIYSLGVIMFQMITGRVPFRGSSSVEIIYKHVNQPVPPIHELAPEADCPPELETVIRKSLAKSRDDRYASMSDFLAAMKDVRRLLIGTVSSSQLELMSNYPLRDTGMVVPASPFANTASLPPSVPSAVPSAAPGRSTLPTPSPAAASIPPPPRAEAAFVDAGIDESRSELRSGRVRALRGRPAPLVTRLIPYVGVLGLLVGAGATAYFLSRPPEEAPRVAATVAPTTPQPTPAVSAAPAPTPVASVAPTPVKLSSHIVFHSNPEGARTYEDGELIGVTPFELDVDRFLEPEVKVWVFRKDGYLDETVRERVDLVAMKIRTTLRPVPAPAPDPEPRRPTGKKPPQQPRKEGGGEYKDNPY